ncbi:hypothetical protein [Micromonospora sp. DT47]
MAGAGLITVVDHRLVLGAAAVAALLLAAGPCAALADRRRRTPVGTSPGR